MNFAEIEADAQIIIELVLVLCQFASQPSTCQFVLEPPYGGALRSIRVGLTGRISAKLFKYTTVPVFSQQVCDHRRRLNATVRTHQFNHKFSIPGRCGACGVCRTESPIRRAPNLITKQLGVQVLLKTIFSVGEFFPAFSAYHEIRNAVSPALFNSVPAKFGHFLPAPEEPEIAAHVSAKICHRVLIYERGHAQSQIGIMRDSRSLLEAGDA
jgi:hypothetical protein